MRNLVLGILIGAIMALSVTVVADTFTFEDVSADNPHAEDIEWLAETGITVGCADGLFCPDDAVTRAQMASFLRRTTGHLDARVKKLEVDVMTQEKRINDLHQAIVDLGG